MYVHFQSAEVDHPFLDVISHLMESIDGEPEIMLLEWPHSSKRIHRLEASPNKRPDALAPYRGSYIVQSHMSPSSAKRHPETTAHQDRCASFQAACTHILPADRCMINEAYCIPWDIAWKRNTLGTNAILGLMNAIAMTFRECHCPTTEACPLLPTPAKRLIRIATLSILCQMPANRIQMERFQVLTLHLHGIRLIATNAHFFDAI